MLSPRHPSYFRNSNKVDLISTKTNERPCLPLLNDLTLCPFLVDILTEYTWERCWCAVLESTQSCCPPFVKLISLYCSRMTNLIHLWIPRPPPSLGILGVNPRQKEWKDCSLSLKFNMLFHMHRTLIQKSGTLSRPP